MAKDYQTRTLYTCCNIHHEGDSITDANYYVGSTIPFGTPVHIEKLGHHDVTFSADGARLTLDHNYGKDQESFQQYLDKVLVATDPKPRVASFPRSVQEAIRDGRVEQGMTREQVILAIGYPATHKTPSTAAPE